MKTALIPSPSSSTTLSPSPAPAPAAGAPERAPGPGRPSGFNERMIEGLCSIIRETGASDSGAAARMSLHPSTVSRWKRDFPDFALLLRGAREEFRAAQLEIIMEATRMGGARGWRAAAWMLERVFPQDYAPRAAERARFQELFEAECAREAEGAEIALPDRGEPLQNVQKSALPAPRPEPQAAVSHGAPEPALNLTADARRGAPEIHRPGRPLQNVKNSALAGAVCPPTLNLNAAGRVEEGGEWQR